MVSNKFTKLCWILSSKSQKAFYTFPGEYTITTISRATGEIFVRQNVYGLLFSGRCTRFEGRKF